MIKENIILYAKNQLGIDAIGFTTPEIPKKDLENYYKYLEEKNYADMLWMESRKHLRENPKNLMPEAETVIVLGCNYYHEPTIKKDYEISIYANQQEDYHIWFYNKIKELSKYLSENFNSSQRHFVDSAPIMEKVLAKQTPLGWQGKHTCIVSREFGSWLFLGVILTSLKIEPDSPHKDFCGTCTKCIDACPTGALSPYKIDTKKCISYLTIEHKGDIPKDIASKFGNKVFGCDICLKACPFNKWQKQSNHNEASENQNFPNSLEAFLSLKPDEYSKTFKNTPLKRTGQNNLNRNINAIKNNI
jgi:epoxyqueuosine reductase